MTSDMNETIDLSKPIEAYEGDVSCSAFLAYQRYDMNLQVRWMRNGYPCEGAFRRDGSSVAGWNWRIRNVAQPTPASEVPAALLERCVALVKRLADNRYTGFEWHEDAIEIVAELTPVDGDRVLAQELFSVAWPDGKWHKSEQEPWLAVARHVRARELERGEG